VINKFYLLYVIFSGSPDLTLKTCLVYYLYYEYTCLIQIGLHIKAVQIFINFIMFWVVWGAFQ